MDVKVNLYIFALLQWAVPSEQKLLFSKKKDDTYFRRIFNVPIKDCLKECLARSLCHSINYHRASKTCELNKATNDSSGLRKGRGWIYGEKSSFASTTFSHCSCSDGKKCVVASKGSQCVFEECDSLTEKGHSNMVTVGARSEHKLVCVRDIVQFDVNRDSTSNIYPLVCTPEGTWGIQTESSCYAIAFVLNSNTYSDAYLAWLKGDNSHSDIECLTSFTCQHHYRNDIIELWNHLSVSKIRFSIFKNQMEVQFIVFDGNNSSYTDWFSHIRVTESSWLDLVNTSQEIENMKVNRGYTFSMQGHQVENKIRRFYINKLYNRCTGDQGWFLASFLTDYKPRACKWEKPSGASTPFMYSIQDTMDLFGNAMHADRVYILFKFKVPSNEYVIENTQTTSGQ